MKKPVAQGRIFLSYRREDSSGYAGRLFDHIKNHFGEDRVFMDISNIEPGTDFVDSIEKALGTCDAFLVLIGRNWLDCRDAKGERRLDNPDDFIRIETSTALKRDVRVFPILVKGAEMPTAADLPVDMAKLARRNAHELSDQRWEFDCNELLQVLETIVGPALQPKPDETEEQKTSSGKKNIKAIISLALSALAIFGLATEGIEDSDALVGAIALVVVALILGVVGLYDVKMKKAGGRGLAISSIVASVLVTLMLVGQLPSEPVAIHSTLSEPIMAQGSGEGTVKDQPAASVKPPTATSAPPPATPAKQYAPIGGNWQGSDGMIYIIQQRGRQVSVLGLNTFGAQVMTGQGVFTSTDRVQFEYSLADGSYGESTLQVVANGQQMNGSFTNHATGLFGQIVLSRATY